MSALDFLNEVSSTVMVIITIISIIIGLLQCFFGYRIFKFIIGLFGFAFGAVLAFGILYAVDASPFFQYAGALVAGVLGAALFVGLYFVAIFLLGGAFSIFILFIIAQDASSAANIIVFVIGGVLAVVLQRIFIIIFTAFGGAWSVVTGVADLFDGSSETTIINYMQSSISELITILVITVILGLIGAVFQFITTSGD